MSDDLTKKRKDGQYINCNQEHEISVLLGKGYSKEAVEFCCDKDLGNNPKDKFMACLKRYREIELKKKRETNV